MWRTIRNHIPEYACEALELCLFMISAGLFTILLEHPASPVVSALPGPFVRRMLLGIAMGMTAISIVFSPFGKRSGAHFNPAVTLTFWRLGKVKGLDAIFYIIAQFLGGIAGVALVALFVREALSNSAVNFVATMPGAGGVTKAFVAELVIAFILMSTVLIVSNTRLLARYTGIFAGCLVATFITFEAPLSGMSMNPARTFGSAFVGHLWTALWIYFTAPVIAMQLAASIHLRSKRVVYCAKLHHHNRQRCIFNCRFAELGAVIVASFLALNASAASLQVEAIGMTVSEANRAAEFYSQLGFQKVSEVEVLGREYEQLTGVFGVRMRIVRMQLGGEFIDLTQYIAPPGRKIPEDSRSNDLWFQHIAIVVRDMDEAFARLRALKVQFVSSAPQTLPPSIPAAAGIKAFYFRDPDGHNLEVIYFPPGKGDPRWQTKADKLFLGIDHTAIGISNTAASLAFYRDLLGMRKAGESENFGNEQEHLNQVFGAHLLVTGLRAERGPGVEFLEYLTPRDGRPRPVGTKANDIVHWQTIVATDDLAAAAQKLRQAHASLVSSNVTVLQKELLGFARGLMVSDPDGHDILLIEK